MKIRINSGVTYQSRANIFPPVRKNLKKGKIIGEKNAMYDKIHEHFSKFDLIKLDAFGDDIDNYGNLTIKGISYPPKKIKMDFIKKRIINEEKNNNDQNIFSFEEEDNILSSNRKVNQKINYPPLNLPSLGLKKNKSQSMENLNIHKFKIINKKININNKINININNNNKSFERYNDNNKNYDENKLLKNHKSKSCIKIENENKLPLLHNNINVTNKNVKLFLQTNKLEVKTDNNRKNHILKRNYFLRRYDNTTDLNNKLNKLRNDIKKVNGLISKVVDKNDEDIPQFNLRFHHLLSQFKN